MADKNVQIKDLAGNNIFPKTKGSIVINNAGGNLGDVEAGAQVNKIETIKVNGVAQGVASKSVNITIPAGSEYSIVKQATPDNGFSATYYLTKDGAQAGEKINIAKDMVVESGTVRTCTNADSPVIGYKVGDKYIDLVLANADSSHIYILVSDLVDVNTAGFGITISGTTISVDSTALSNTFATKDNVTAQLGGKADKATTLAGYGITDAYKKAEVDTKVNDKADKSTTLEGYGITNAYNKSQTDALISDFLTYEELV